MPEHHGGHAPQSPSRRLFLRRSSEVAFATAIAVSAGGALISATEAWGLEVEALRPETMKTLILMSRDIYPHDRIADRYYAIAAKPFDAKAAADPAQKEMFETGVAELNALAGPGRYVGVGWEADRVALLQKISGQPMFETVRATLVVSLYNQKEIWPIFGYEGESFSKGGYIHRGFDDLDWL
ncbi:gluconate 2-dehydrogenase subunit 3 family protein [Rhodoblastus acidophilus]|uniref:Gluconate 2-dehydrogenase subunit 3 family protein n=1 Tax=Candidatus Rhodoblastus alkanivorans TaxID=2954117 RepID=A0ABS9ZAC0_9HYPH|nr:gluconate 2-dehydrogenase subunit 3 family protein [Candidatus Rhodoblastus alkanivorans]MCI4677858.1 gluconate 2-dehydrogenase subunit 3 family protein [Candidatus Rhodoblastus alkanivorans]MCI4684643.1 gluconate 2-dehydrogenase subunit 3 family protein [Candidatus Rhodoblastus alkanivorans]MDI4641965.1 gluconate 2-dehydrogenase subunit 3 family protein [Rhodoblastus acidophilus]